MRADYPGPVERKQVQLRLDPRSASAGEKHGQRDEREDKQQWVNDHTAGDGDDEQDYCQYQQHFHPLPFLR